MHDAWGVYASRTSKVIFDSLEELLIGGTERIRAWSTHRDVNIIHCEERGECEIELREDSPFPVTS